MKYALLKNLVDIDLITYQSDKGLVTKNVEQLLIDYETLKAKLKKTQMLLFRVCQYNKDYKKKIKWLDATLAASEEKEEYV